MIKIIAIHGFLGNNEMWKEILPSHFPFSFYTPQLAGHGNNDNLSSSSIEEFANHVLQQIEPNDSDEYIWIGHSMGGYVAAHLAKKFPTQTKAILFFHSTADADSELKKKDRLRAIEIAEKAGELYDKLFGFIETMEDVGAGIKKANINYEKAMGQLSTGKGNAIKKAVELKGLGADAKKQFPDRLIDNSEV